MSSWSLTRQRPRKARAASTTSPSGSRITITTAGSSGCGRHAFPRADRSIASISAAYIFVNRRAILFEIATDGPGFTADEPLDALGESLALPPFLEPRRAEIEAGLKSLNRL